MGKLIHVCYNNKFVDSELHHLAKCRKITEYKLI